MPLRLKTLQLSWFRGAAAEFVLDTGGKSVAIYGPNGAGKSSLVDALEFVLSAGKVGHLANEYSGRRLEHAVPNTHTPTGMPSVATVTLCDGNQSSVTLGSTGMPRACGSEHVASWSPARSILRQDAVTAFVTSTKLDKYKSVLPLLGFEPLETAASNLRAVKLEVEKQTQLERKKGELASIRGRRQTAFPGMDGSAISTFIKGLVGSYLPEAPLPTSLGEAIKVLEPELQRRLDGLDEANSQHALFCQIRDAKLTDCLTASAAAATAAARVAQPLLSERLTVLRASRAYTTALVEGSAHDAIDCPACGRLIEVFQFVAHVTEEVKKLTGALRSFDELTSANKATATALATVQKALKSKVLNGVWPTANWALLRPSLHELLAFDSKAVEGANAADTFSRLSAAAEVLLPKIEVAASHAPASTQQLVRDRDAVRAAAEWEGSRVLRKEIEEAGRLTGFLEEAETAVRDEIRLQSTAVIAEISDDVAVMWAVLHPDEPIDGVGLYQHADLDKAIDLKLRFHGKDLISPRLTLSEGHRNSLGLCVFLALAKRGHEPSPIILDDVVTSFDREHRASVTDLLLNHMGSLQLIVLTHEYDWFIDLSNRLPGRLWSFQQLRPFSEPAIGIQWGGVPAGFEPARALLDQDPSAAANKARGLLDVHLAVVSERLKISMPFIRGPRNELRHADEMLQRFAAKSTVAFKKRSIGGMHEPCPGPSQAAIDLKHLLVPFANPPSHGRSIPRSESERLIKAAERFLSVLVCEGCKYAVTRSEVSNKHNECECGMLRWTL